MDEHRHQHERDLEHRRLVAGSQRLLQGVVALRPERREREVDEVREEKEREHRAAEGLNLDQGRVGVRLHAPQDEPAPAPVTWVSFSGFTTTLMLKTS